MRKLVYVLSAAAVITACSTSPKVPHFKITGRIAGADSITFILQKRADGTTVKIDSAMVLNGEFVIKGGAVDYPETVTLKVKGRRAGLSFYLENTDIVITGHIDSLNNAKVAGSKTQDEYSAYQTLLTSIDEKNNNLYAEFNAAKTAGDKARMAEIEKKREDIYNEQTTLDKEFVKSHPTSYFTPTLLQGLSYELEATEIESLINTLDTNIAKVAIIKELKDRVAVMKQVAVGQKAPDFTLNDVNDKPVALSSKIGKSKLLLVDFWASWCGPCRSENPNVVKVFKEFNKKGFDVLGVSLDSKKEEWIKGIAEDKLPWTQVTDLLRGNSPVAKLYAVNSIPSNFLLDETGTIIDRNLRGEKLYDRVKELLDKK